MRLMIVDDSIVDQMLNKRIFERAKAFDELVQFTDPAEALTHLIEKRSPRPDLVLLDINMPVIDGFEFLERVEEQLGGEMCPVVVMLTTSLNPSDEKRAMTFNIVKDFLNKPISEAMLHELARQIRDATE